MKIAPPPRNEELFAPLRYFSQGRRNIVRAGGAIKKLRAMKTYEKQNQFYLST